MDMCKTVTDDMVEVAARQAMERDIVFEIRRVFEDYVRGTFEDAAHEVFDQCIMSIGRTYRRLACTDIKIIEEGDRNSPSDMYLIVSFSRDDEVLGEYRIDIDDVMMYIDPKEDIWGGVDF